jgi:Fic family protein
MKMPAIPPSSDAILDLFKSDPTRGLKILEAAEHPVVGERYPHWDKLRYYKDLPDGLTAEEWWHALKFRRRSLYKSLPLRDKSGNRFVYLLADPTPEVLHKIDLGSGGLIQMPEQITNPETRDQYYVSSLIEEAITSSQLEGASTTRVIAKEMIRTGRPPRDKSERMILNNYIAMREIQELKNEPLTKELVFRIHQIVTDGTMDDPTSAGRFRRTDENVRVEDAYGTVFHEPPSASSLESRMDDLCKFANGITPDGFIYPALRSIIIHFMLSYDHPFVDGNGRTARALFYWSMLHHKYWLFEFISISKIIRKGPIRYARAFLYTETDDNDVTYFIRYHLYVIRKAIEELHEYIKRKTAEILRLEGELRGIEVLNHRQRTLIGHALRHPRQRYTIESHRVSQNIVYETARSDLLDLRDRGLLNGAKVGKTWYFSPIKNLEKYLAKMTPG